MKKKILVACLCVALAVLTIAGTTLAYLTSKDTVTNTFTVGNVSITLDEKDTDNDTNSADNVTINNVVRDKANAYHLMPGVSYEKDPTVHVANTSDDSWIFVKVENGISAFEADNSSEEGGYKNIANQIVGNGWTALTGVTGVTGVYYKEFSKLANTTGTTDYIVFSNFQISDAANTVDGWDAIGDSNNIVVTAYAIQKAGFTTAAAAWAEVSKPAT